MTLPLRALAALAAMLFTLFPVAAVANPAVSDGCGDLDLTDGEAVQERGAAVDDVFVGRVEAVTPGNMPGGAAQLGESDDASATATATPGGTSLHRVLILEPLAGDRRTGRFVDVVFTPTETVADRRLRDGGRYVFFTVGLDKTVQADACDGFVAAGGLDDEELAFLRNALAAEPAPPAPEVPDPPADADAAPELGRLVAPGGAISLIGVLGLVLIGRIGRQRA